MRTILNNCKTYKLYNQPFIASAHIIQERTNMNSAIGLKKSVWGLTFNHENDNLSHCMVCLIYIGGKK